MRYLASNLCCFGLCYASSVAALDSMHFAMASLQTGAVRLNKVRMQLADLQQPNQTLRLQAEQLLLPEPFKQMELVNIDCRKFTMQEQQLRCSDGRVTLKIADLQLQAERFSFNLSPAQSRLTLAAIKFAQGTLSLSASAEQVQWQVQLKAQKLALVKLQRLLQQPVVVSKNGTLSLNLRLQGEQHLQVLNSQLQVQDMTLESQQGKFATEKLTLANYLSAQKQAQDWVWQTHSSLQQGALYSDPIYIPAQAQAISLDAVGSWQQARGVWQIDYAQLLHPPAGSLLAQGLVQPGAEPWLPQASLTLNAKDMQTLSNIYIVPFLLGSTWDGLKLQGQLQAQLSLEQQAVQTLSLHSSQLELSDTQRRFGLRQGKIAVDWSRTETQMQAGQLSWQELLIYGLPLGASQIPLALAAEQVKLLRPVSIPTLGGVFRIDDFSWQSRKPQAPEVHFAGELQALSLDQLTSLLHWTPLAGKISGAIPGIRYQKNRLELEGAITVQLFDGNIVMDNLAVANLFSPVPKFYADFVIEHLNLSQLTEKFKFGGIQGQLSGFVNDVYLENWQPISFYAWLGTPENDTSKHSISQKAVDNIASIGGNGATDLISKGVLGVFDSFGYDALGISCYLHKGVCQLMGVAAADNGYYLVKGGGLPRIDVIGYNPKVDWQVLVQRLQRLHSTDNMVIE